MSETTIRSSARFAGELDSESDPAHQLTDELAAVVANASSYASFRKRLISYFRRRGVVDSENAADEAICRALRRAPSHACFLRYCFRVARNIVFEEWKARTFETLPADAYHVRQVEKFPNQEAMVLLQQCLNHLSPEDHALLVTYECGDSLTRAALARASRTSANAMRVRISRIKDRLNRWAESPGRSQAHRHPHIHL